MPPLLAQPASPKKARERFSKTPPDWVKTEIFVPPKLSVFRLIHFKKGDIIFLGHEKQK